MSDTIRAEDLPFWLTVLGRKNKKISKEDLYFFCVHSSSVKAAKFISNKTKPSCWDGGYEPHLLSKDTQGYSCYSFISKQGSNTVRLHKHKNIIILLAKQ